MRNFYIIGHNPNTLDEVRKVLNAGGNAIEPDVQHHKDGNFYVHEELPLINLIEPSGPLLKDYLGGLCKMLEDNPNWNLRLIVFDLKPPFTYNINELYTEIHNNFSSRFPDVMIFTTVGSPDGLAFLSGIGQLRPNEYIGVDEGGIADVMNTFFKAKSLQHVYANGNSYPLVSTALHKYADQIREAIDLRGMPNGFSYVYAWTVNEVDSMRFYLDMGVDGMITDHPDRLLQLVQTEFSDKFKIA